MKSEGHVDTNKLSASRKDKNFTKCADLKLSRRCNMTSCLSTQGTTRKRESTTGEFNAGVNFDDKEEFQVNQQNEDSAQGKRKLPRKTKGLNVKSKLRKTFSMCCAIGQDISLDEEDTNEYDNIEREKRADEDGTNGEHTGDKSATPIDKQPKTGEEKHLQNFWKIVKPYHITEDPNMCSTPTNVLQVYAADINPLLLKRGEGDPVVPPDTLILDSECSDLTTSDSSTSASSGSISALLDQIDADSSSPRRCTDLKDLTLLRSFNINSNTSTPSPNIDTFINSIDKQPDDGKISPSVPINQHLTFSQNDVTVTEIQHQNCMSDFPILANQQLSSCKIDSAVPVNSQLNTDNEIENQRPAPCSVDSTVQGSNQTANKNDIKVLAEQQTAKSISTVHVNPRSTADRNDPTLSANKQFTSGEIDPMVPLQTIDHVDFSASVNYENSNNGPIRPDSESSSSVQHKCRLLHAVHSMLLSGEIGFVRLPANAMPGADDGKLLEFIYSNSGLSHEEARDILKGINRLINNKVIEFKFSEDASPRNFTVSSFNGEKLTLSQDIISSALDDEMNSNEQNSPLDGEETKKSKVSAVVNDIFDAADNCDKKMTEYIKMIRDERFPTVLEDILRLGEGRISSVTDYVDILRDGHFYPVLDGIVDADDSDNSSQLRDYIRTITEGNFCTALENALKDCRGNSYSLFDYIQVIRDENIIAALGVTLLASELPVEYAQALVQGTFRPEVGDLSNSTADASTPYSISVEVLRRISAIRNNIARKRAIQNAGLLIKNVDGFISPLSAKGHSHDTTSDIPEPDVQFSDVSDSDPISVCDWVSAIPKMNANCHDDSHQDSNITFVDDVLFQQGNTGNENLQSSKHETYKVKENGAKWTVGDPIVRPKTFNRSTKCGSTREVKNRSKSKYNDSKTRSSGATITTTDGTSMLDKVSGTTEVKRSKAEYAMDLTEREDTSNTIGIQNRVIKTARRTRRVAIQEDEFTMFKLETDTVRTDEKKEKKPTVNVLPPLHFIDTDVNDLKEEEAKPVYIETEATIDYGRCVVEPGHGERPDKKKLRAEIKEKVKTKGEANKHLRNERECHATDYDAMMEEYLAETIDDTERGDDIEDEPEEQEEGARAASPVVLNAVDQPQVLDDREFHLVPEEIKRADDPYLDDVEEDYKVSTTHSSKKEKRKQKDDRKKEKRSRKGGQTVFKLS